MVKMKKILNDTRIENKYSYRYLAEVGGLSKSQIQKIHVDESTPIPFENEGFRKILDLYGLPYEDISLETEKDRSAGHNIRQLKELLVKNISQKSFGCSPHMAIPPVIQAVCNTHFIDENLQEKSPEIFFSHLSIHDFFNSNSGSTLFPIHNYEGESKVASEIWDFLSSYREALVILGDLIKHHLEEVIYYKGYFSIMYLNKKFDFYIDDFELSLDEVGKEYIRNNDFKALVDSALNLVKK